MNIETDVYNAFENLKPVVADWEDFLAYLRIDEENKTLMYAVESLMCRVMDNNTASPNDSFKEEFDRCLHIARKEANIAS